MKYLKMVDETSHAAREFLETKSDLLEKVIVCICRQLESGHKILIFGNGGSAAQSQHFAAELVNKFLKKRPPFAAIALNTDTSALTSIANDENYDRVFSRQVEALGKNEDIALGLSTSGISPSVIKALEKARQLGLTTIAMTGKGGGKLSFCSDFLFKVPSVITPRIQEVHLLLLHIMAEEIEKRLT